MIAALSLRAITRALSREPILARVPRTVTMTAALLIAGLALAHESAHADEHDLWWQLSNGEPTLKFAQEIQGLHLHPAPGSRIVFLNDPFPGSYTALFVSTLVWGDRSLDINLQRVYPLPDDQVAQRDYIFDYADGHVIQRKPGP
jgi:hypothetical protein